jgi:hypothetical protein
MTSFIVVSDRWALLLNDWGIMNIEVIPTLVSKTTSPQVGFVQSQYDECVFYHGKAIYVLYTDDSILAGPDEDELNVLIARIKSIGLDITEEGS